MKALAAGFDRPIHAWARLGMLSALAAAGTLSVTAPKDLPEPSDGNLSVHARELEEGSLACLKSFDGPMPTTECRLT